MAHGFVGLPEDGQVGGEERARADIFGILPQLFFEHFHFAAAETLGIGHAPERFEGIDERHQRVVIVADYFERAVGELRRFLVAAGRK